MGPPQQPDNSLARQVAFKAIEVFRGITPGMPRAVDEDVIAFCLDALRFKFGDFEAVDACILGSAKYGLGRMSASARSPTGGRVCSLALAALWQPSPVERPTDWLVVVAYPATKQIIV